MLQFANPAALWLLTLIPPLILLYLLKRRRRDVVVPSVMLWKQVLEDLRANRPFQKLRSQLLLYLQILIVVLITAILSGPRLVESSQLSRRMVLVMDISASMQATDEKPSRFEVAREKLRREMESAAPADEILLLTVGAEASVLQSFTTSRSAVRARLDSLQPEDTAGNWMQLGRVLEPLLKETPVPRVVIASDFSGLPDEMKRKIAFNPLQVGSSGENVAITRVVAEPLPESPEIQQLFYQIRNCGHDARQADVQLFADNQLIDAFSIEVGPDADVDRTANLKVTAPLEIKVHIDPSDALALDNEFVLRLEPSSRMDVQAEYDNPFLIKALGALPSVQISKTGRIRVSKTETADQDEPGIYFVEPPASAPSGRVVEWNSTHPVLRFVDPGLWSLARYGVLAVPADAVVLMETGGGPVAYARETARGRAVVLGFRLEDSNVYSLAGFPVMMQNALLWIYRDLQESMPSLTGPAHLKEGEYDSGTRRGFINFADSRESAIAPGTPAAPSASGVRKMAHTRDLSRWFLLLAISIVIVEWWAFHRRMEL